MKQQSLRKWFRWLIQWVRQIFTQRDSDHKLLTVLERTYSNDEQTVLLSVERDAPGAVATWYLIHKHNPHHNLLITLDNLAEIRLELRRNRQRKSKLSPLELSLIQDDRILRTHRFSVQWIIELNTSRKIFSLIGTWDSDLQGNSIDANASAIRIFRLIVREALNLQPIPGVPWRGRMVEYPWAESVQSYAKTVLGEQHESHIKKIDLKALKGIENETEGGKPSKKRYTKF